jgi:hypothetical protein
VALVASSIVPTGAGRMVFARPTDPREGRAPAEGAAPPQAPLATPTPTPPTDQTSAESSPSGQY